MFRLVLTLAAIVLLLPGTAAAAGCEVIADPRERAECAARQHAREAARAEVAAKVDDRSGDSSSRSPAWQAAIDDADGFDAGGLLDEPRPLAAIIGVAWFGLVVRARLRRRRRTSASAPA